MVLGAGVDPADVRDAIADVTPIRTEQARHAEVGTCCAACGF